MTCMTRDSTHQIIHSGNSTCNLQVDINVQIQLQYFLMDANAAIFSVTDFSVYTDVFLVYWSFSHTIL